MQIKIKEVADGLVSRLYRDIGDLVYPHRSRRKVVQRPAAGRPIEVRDSPCLAGRHDGCNLGKPERMLFLVLFAKRITKVRVVYPGHGITIGVRVIISFRIITRLCIAGQSMSVTGTNQNLDHIRVVANAGRSRQ